MRRDRPRQAPVTSHAARPLSNIDRLDSLTGMRFLAAALVVLHHTVANPIAQTSVVQLAAIRPLATVGYVGVTFFFVLSGFVLTWSWESAATAGVTRIFYARRFARIFPLHLLGWAVAFLVLWQTGAGTSLAAALLGLVLLQAWSPNSSIAFGQNSVSWSLSCEAFFYALFPLLIARVRSTSRRGLLGLLAAAVAYLALLPVIAFEGLHSRQLASFLRYLPVYRVGEFVVGICLALLVRRGLRIRVPIGWITLAAGLWLGALALVNLHAKAVVSAASTTSGLPQVAGSLAVLPIVSVWLVAAASADLNARPSFLRSRFLVRLGTWSYALYVTHHLVLREGEYLAGADVTGSLGTRIAVVLGCFAVVVLISAVTYVVLERPAERWLRRVLSAQHRPGGTRQPARRRGGPLDSMRVLAVNPSADGYGADRVFIDNVLAMRGAGVDVQVMIAEPGRSDAALAEAGVAVAPLPSPVLRKSLLRVIPVTRLLLAAPWRVHVLARSFRAADVDLVYVNTSTLPHCLWAARLARTPVVCHVHELESSISRLLSRAITFPLLAATSVVANSHATAAHLRRDWSRLGRRTQVVHNGIQAPLHVTVPVAVRRLGVVGRLSPRKGQDVAVAAVSSLVRSGLDVDLVLVGDCFTGYEWFEQRLRRLAAECPGRVRLLGYRADIWQVYASLDVVLVPSRLEPFGNVAVEASLAGRPVIASRVGGLPEIVREGVTGTLVAADDVQALATAIAELVRDPALAQRYGLAGAADAKERFAADRQQADLIRILRDAAASTAGASVPTAT